MLDSLNLLSEALVASAEASATAAESSLDKSLWTALGIMSALGLLLCLFAQQGASRMGQKLEGISNVLSTQVSQLLSAATRLDGVSHELNDSTTKQASSLGQTSASMEEIGAMVGRSTSRATDLKREAQKEQETLARGREAVKGLGNAVQTMGKESLSVVEQIEANAREFNDILKLIGQIESKTSVINDIVFQTKLLSFNASVEAARAGEHGKGFAVVAEEVGKLAQMSGSSAKEISSIVAESVQKVTFVAEESKKKVAGIAERTRSLAERGSREAESCESAMAEMLEAAERNLGSVEEISRNLSEQETGILQVNQAVLQLNDVAQQTTKAAALTTDLSNQLSVGTDELESVLRDLLQLVHGQTAQDQSPTLAPAPEVKSISPPEADKRAA